MVLYSEKLKLFTAAHPCKNMTVDGAQYRYILDGKHRLTRAHREKQLKMSYQALHNAPPNRT